MREVVSWTCVKDVSSHGSDVTGSHFFYCTLHAGHAGRGENLVQSVVVVLEDVHDQKRLVVNFPGEDTAGEIVAVVMDFLALRVRHIGVPKMDARVIAEL